jgi:hypothetical protein
VRIIQKQDADQWSKQVVCDKWDWSNRIWIQTSRLIWRSRLSTSLPRSTNKPFSKFQCMQDCKDGEVTSSLVTNVAKMSRCMEPTSWM